MQLNFANGWGVSIIDFGYGSDEGLLELAVRKDGRLHYANPVSMGDVRRWLTDDEANKLASEVVLVSGPNFSRMGRGRMT